MFPLGFGLSSSGSTVESTIAGNVLAHTSKLPNVSRPSPAVKKPREAVWLPFNTPRVESTIWAKAGDSSRFRRQSGSRRGPQDSDFRRELAAVCPGGTRVELSLMQTAVKREQGFTSSARPKNKNPKIYRSESGIIPWRAYSQLICIANREGCAARILPSSEEIARSESGTESNRNDQPFDGTQVPARLRCGGLWLYCARDRDWAGCHDK